MKRFLKILHELGPWPFLILLVALKTIQRRVISYDGFIGGPEAILKDGCKVCLEDYFHSNGTQLVHMTWYFALDIALAVIVWWTLVFLFKKYCQIKINSIKYPLLVLSILCAIFFFLDMWENYLAYDFYWDHRNEMTDPTPEVTLPDLNNYKKLYWPKLLAYGSSILWFLSFYLWNQTLERRKSIMDYLKSSQNPYTKIEDGLELNSPHLVKDIFWKVIASFGVTILLGLLLSIVDQGPMLVYNLVEKTPQFIIALLLFLIMGWMTLFNPYYVDLKLYNKNQFALPSNRGWIYPFGNSFNWSKIEFKDNDPVIKSFLKETNGGLAFFQRYAIIAQTWFTIFVLCFLWSKVIYLDPYLLVFLFSLVPINVLLTQRIFNKYGKLVRHKENYKEDEKLPEIGKDVIKARPSIYLYVTKMKWLSKYFMIALFFGFLFTVFQFLLADTQAKLFCAILIMSCVNIVISIFLVIRRKISFFEEHNLKVFFICKFFGNDRNGRITQLICFVVIIFLAFILYFLYPDFIYKINPIIIVFSFLIITFFFFQSVAAHKTQLLFSPEIPKYSLLFHVLLRLLVIYMIGIFINNTVLQNSQLHILPLVEKYDDPSNQEEKIDLITHINNMDDSFDHFYMIANEGGGLRANLWSMLVLNKLDEKSGGEFYNHVIATCGASGGAIGQGLFHLLKKRELTGDEIKPIIKKVSETDFLSRDMFSLLFERTVSMLVPRSNRTTQYVNRQDCKFRGDMVQTNKYASLVYEKDLKLVLDEDSSFHNSIERWWYSARNDSLFKNKHFPLPILQGTNVETGLEGVVCPLIDASQIFNGVHVINDLKLTEKDCENDTEVKSISYLDALFLANRFPLMSPVATIPGKGSYNDAGSFDNTGVSSLLDIMIYLEAEAAEEKIRRKDSIIIEGRYQNAFNKVKNKITLIVIQNSQESFAKDYFKEWTGNLNELNSYENLTSNLKSATSTSAVKNYLHNVAERKQGTYFHKVEYISLPYLILDKQNVDDIFKGQVHCDQKVWSKIDSLNEERFDSHKLHGEFYFKAPLGRVINSTVYDFIKTELEHQDLNDQIESILEPLNRN